MNQKTSMIGRSVHYCTDNVPGSENPLCVRAAIITEVGEEGIAGLMVFEPTSVTTARHVPYSDEYARGCWTWPQQEPAPAAEEPAPKKTRARSSKSAAPEANTDATAPEAGGEGTAEQ